VVDKERVKTGEDVPVSEPWVAHALVVDPEWNLTIHPKVSGPNWKYLSTNNKEAIFQLWQNNSDMCLAHVVGSDFSLGKGFAKELKKRYRSMCPDFVKGGTEGVPAILMNTATQNRIHRVLYHMVAKEASGIPGKEYKDYVYNLRECVQQVFDSMTCLGYDEVIMPWLIGCGCDGLDENDVLSWLIDLAKEHNITIYFVHLRN